MTWVIDASVAVKWVLAEEGTHAANALRGGERLIAPSLIFAEIGNALWKAVTQRSVRSEDAVVAMAAAVEAFHETFATDILVVRALELATELRHPIYDCFYLALAERERAPLISADQQLLKAAARLKSVETRPL